MTGLPRAATAAFFFALAIASPRAAHAADPLPPNCGEHREITGVLTDRYGEYLAMSGRAPNGGLELWISSARSWSLLRVMPGGVACLIAAGTDVQFAKPASPKGSAI